MRRDHDFARGHSALRGDDEKSPRRLRQVAWKGNENPRPCESGATPSVVFTEHDGHNARGLGQVGRVLRPELHILVVVDPMKAVD